MKEINYVSKGGGYDTANGFPYNKGDFFEVVYKHKHLVKLRHKKTSTEFLITETQLEENYMQVYKLTTHQQHGIEYVKKNIYEVDSGTLDKVVEIIRENIEPQPQRKTDQERIAALEAKLDMHTEIHRETVELLREQQEYFEKKIGVLRYKAYQAGFII